MTPRLATATLAALLLVAPATAAQASPPVPPGTQAFAHSRLEATASDDSGELLVVTADQDGTGATHHFLLTTRDPSGTWGAPIDLVADPTGLLGDAELALASDGTGVLVWNQYLKPNQYQDTVWTRVRHADGTWGAATKIGSRKDVFNFDHAMAVPGHVGVAFAGTNYKLYAATASSDGTGWRTTRVPGDGGDDGTTVVMDSRGGLHTILNAIPRGGGGDIWLSRLAPGATKWTKQQHLTTPYLSTDSAQLAIDSKDREMVLFGYVGHNGYRPPGDSEDVGATAYRLVRQSRAGGATFTTIWQNAAAGRAVLSQGDGKVRVSYEQWKGHVGRHPRTVQLRTQVLGSSSSIKLATATQGHFLFTAAGGTQFAVSWLAPKVKQLYAAGTSGTPVLLDSRADEAIWGYWAEPGQPVVAGAQPFVGWNHRFVQDDDQQLVDSDASVAPLP